jgi:hypothetical protein
MTIRHNVRHGNGRTSYGIQPCRGIVHGDDIELGGSVVEYRLRRGAWRAGSLFGAQPPLQPCARYQQPLLLEESATAGGITQASLLGDLSLLPFFQSDGYRLSAIDVEIESRLQRRREERLDFDD